MTAVRLLRLLRNGLEFHSPQVVVVWASEAARSGVQDGQIPFWPTLATLDGYPLLHHAGRGITQRLVDQADGLTAFGSDTLLTGLELSGCGALDARGEDG